MIVTEVLMMTTVLHRPCTRLATCCVCLEYGDPPRLRHLLDRLGRDEQRGYRGAGAGARPRALSHRCVRVAAVSSSGTPVFDA